MADPIVAHEWPLLLFCDTSNGVYRFTFGSSSRRDEVQAGKEADSLFFLYSVVRNCAIRGLFVCNFQIQHCVSC